MDPGAGHGRQPAGRCPRCRRAPWCWPRRGWQGQAERTSAGTPAVNPSLELGERTQLALVFPRPGRKTILSPRWRRDRSPGRGWCPENSPVHSLNMQLIPLIRAVPVMVRRGGHGGPPLRRSRFRGFSGRVPGGRPPTLLGRAVAPSPLDATPPEPERPPQESCHSTTAGRAGVHHRTRRRIRPQVRHQTPDPRPAAVSSASRSSGIVGARSLATRPPVG